MRRLLAKLLSIFAPAEHKVPPFRTAHELLMLSRRRAWKAEMARQERLWSYDARAGTLTLVEPDVEARARAGSF